MRILTIGARIIGEIFSLSYQKNLFMGILISDTDSSLWRVSNKHIYMKL